MDYLLSISDELVKSKKLTPQEFVDLSEIYIGKIEIIDSGERVEKPFHQMLTDALTTQKNKAKFKASVS
jgi:hypothetical protein